MPSQIRVHITGLLFLKERIKENALDISGKLLLKVQFTKYLKDFKFHFKRRGYKVIGYV